MHGDEFSRLGEDTAGHQPPATSHQPTADSRQPTADSHQPVDLLAHVLPKIAASLRRQHVRESDVQDTVQDACLKFLRLNVRGLVVQDLEAFLGTAALRLSRSEFARGAARRRRESAVARPVATEVDPAEGQETAEIRERVQEVLALLPTESRELLTRHVQDGVSLRSLARARGIPNSTLADQFARVVRRARALICSSSAGIPDFSGHRRGRRGPCLQGGNA